MIMEEFEIKITKQTTKEQIMVINNLSSHSLMDCSKKLQNDEDVVLRFIENSWAHFDYASDRLKSDREFIKRAIQKNVACFKFGDKFIRKDKKFNVKLIEQSNPEIFHYTYYLIAEAMCQHLKQPAIEYLKNELKKEK